MNPHSVFSKVISKAEIKATKILTDYIFLRRGNFNKLKNEKNQPKKEKAISDESKIANLKLKWRREQDSNLQALTGGSFQDYCISQLCYLSTKPDVRLRGEFPERSAARYKYDKAHYTHSNLLCH